MWFTLWFVIGAVAGYLGGRAGMHLFISMTRFPMGYHGYLVYRVRTGATVVGAMAGVALSAFPLLYAASEGGAPWRSTAIIGGAIIFILPCAWAVQWLWCARLFVDRGRYYDHKCRYGFSVPEAWLPVSRELDEIRLTDRGSGRLLDVQVGACDASLIQPGARANALKQWCTGNPGYTLSAGPTARAFVGESNAVSIEYNDGTTASTKISVVREGIEYVITAKGPCGAELRRVEDSWEWSPTPIRRIPLMLRWL